ncbi:unnamed protein product [Litomosoides sigmodontis]|uniref:Uncharacterized protein n=1 Tax=Litomosoides sigmodontis TaxID=42156 RepID=A0A3P6SJH6_LITSI|nr:unnamed protein product [Litomosoides sigmodontis]
MSRRTAGGIVLIITIDILAVALVDAFPSGYTRPPYLKGGGDGARIPYDGGIGPIDGGQYSDAKDLSSEYGGGKGEPQLYPPPQPPAAGYGRGSQISYGGVGGQLSYGRPSYS